MKITKLILKPWVGLKIGVVGLCVSYAGFKIENYIGVTGTILIVLGWALLMCGIFGHMVWFVSELKKKPGDKGSHLFP